MDQGYHAPSVHCSYYSCLQLLKYSINFFFGVEYSDLKRNIASSKKNSHQYIIEYVSKNLSGNVSITEERNFTRKIKDLKFYREASDYEDTNVDWGNCNKAYSKASDLREFLIKRLNL